ncbi:hypothetical protein [Streptomyces sp. RM99]|uniref:hypothetical protein n=1 Tax=Streptomyces sp. RM99 TaxID=2824897 RepID=UPI001B371B14|nr:hypothetical protein [Streptomyces sp. RM99]MBQ0913346.1 hypothetical protein [Streptomyces sp. RM99]
MNPTDLLASLREHAALLRGELDDETREEVVATLRLLHEETAAGRARGVARALRRLTRVLSVLPPGHPVSAHLGGRRYATEAFRPPSAASVSELIDILGEPPPDPGALLGAARARLLAAPALSSREHERLPGGPPAGTSAPPGVIRLDDPRSGARYPRFQFRPGTAEPLPVVRRVNELLRADRDPWGAADWWLGGNAWLRGVPADLVGTLPDDELVRAAAELVEGDG